MESNLKDRIVTVEMDASGRCKRIWGVTRPYFPKAIGIKSGQGGFHYVLLKFAGCSAAADAAAAPNLNPERASRIESRCAPGGEKTGDQRDREQNNQSAAECERIARAYFIKQVAH